MMRSLWAGVTGLQAHQIAMDVEGNNIANVNTSGFKFSRANFSDLLSQSAKIATAPQGNTGGKNPMQVGLGTEISSVTRMFSQGSIQTTSKNTDLAIQGNGFFVVSPDSGTTYKYTRSGDFVFDANGNFVNNQGLIAQGWVRDDVTGQIDSTAPIGNITIAPGLTTPARETSIVNVKANLNTGDLIENKSVIRELDSTDGLAGGRDPEKVDPFNVLFTADGESFNIKAAEVDKDVTTTPTTINSVTGGEGIEVSFDGGGSSMYFRYTDDPDIVNTVRTEPKLNSDGTAVLDNAGNAVNVDTYYFRSTEDFRAGLQDHLQNTSATATVVVNDEGKFEVANTDVAGNDLSIQVGGITGPATDDNELFTKTMASMAGNLTAGSNGIKISQEINAATHATSIDVFDSLGTKHTVRTEFRKSGFIYDTNGTKVGSTWDMKIIVPEPGDIGGLTRENELEGQIIFNSDGSLASYTPTSITYTANNGSAPNQTIQMNFGSSNGFDGITSFDSASNTSGLSQDGFTGGDLDGIRIDESGTLIGSFTNGRSFGLAQLSMATFTNEIGLESDGGNTFVRTANSGDPVVGSASSGGRGFIQSSALEMSNVDLSRSLTQLIVVQRGYQANSKTITTSDQMLNTLLQLKQ
ncbi:MAG: flagellar hook-basal body complex protein [Epsilonproteobacteria bacterium]|nr:flagellar hook-basal body complex protein [Campylobacterota bacterium]